jgi:hypothetical protein
VPNLMREYIVKEVMLARMTRLGKNRCAKCALPFKLGDRIVSIRSKRMRYKPYHKACFEKMLY